MFCLSLIHGIGLNLTWFPLSEWEPLQWFPWKMDTVLTWYHDFGNLDPWVSLWVSNTHYLSFIRYPFESLGLVALFILFLMAATSHDFLAGQSDRAHLERSTHVGLSGLWALGGPCNFGGLRKQSPPFLNAGGGSRLCLDREYSFMGRA